MITIVLKIVIAEDDLELLSSLLTFVRGRGMEAEGRPSGREALVLLERGADVLLTDLRLADMSGIGLLKEARRLHPGLQVLVMTAFGTIDSAVEAIRLGARNYITKPFDPEELLRHLAVLEDLCRFRAGAAATGRGELLGSSAAMREVFSAVDLAAASDAPLLITGETGTGKELAARAVHDLSARKNGPFVAVNVGALPEALVESELFGHEKGAFTGAHARAEGRFGLAAGGTLLLDELDAMPLPLQPKLLRAIEAREIWPIGAVRPQAVDARIIAASNSPLERLRDGSALRSDLYYRVGVLAIRIPPLRERPEDIPLLVRRFLDQEGRIRGDGKEGEPLRSLEISAEALSDLIQRPWPGNVRELRNIIQHAAARLTFEGPEAFTIRRDHLPIMESEGEFLPFKEGLVRASEEWTVRTIQAALAATGGNVSHAARRLKMNPGALFRLIKRHGIKGDKKA